MAKYSIGFIGAGNIGSGLAKLAVAQQHPVVLSNSRGPESLAKEIEEIGSPLAKAGTSDDAYKCDMVVISIPMKAYKKVASDKIAAGKVVIDTNNYYPDRDGKIPELLDGSTTSSELMAAHIPQAKVVKAFNTIAYFDLDKGTPKGSKNRRALPIAGDDAAAKQQVADLVDSFGFEPVDIGALKEGKFLKPIPIGSTLMGAFLPSSWNKSMLGYIPVYGTRLTEKELRKALKSNGWKPSDDKGNSDEKNEKKDEKSE